MATRFDSIPNSMSRNLTWIIAAISIIAPGLHLLSDILEWFNGGFSRPQLLINYAAFLMMPFVFIGLCAIDWPRIGWIGLLGSALYTVSFIYFAHTTLLAIELSIQDYEQLWSRLGGVYTLHGGLMIVGGLSFGIAAIRARTLWTPGVVVFLAGIAINLFLATLPVAEVWQTVGSSFRNLGLIGIGIRRLYANDGTE